MIYLPCWRPEGGSQCGQAFIALQFNPAVTGLESPVLLLSWLSVRGPHILFPKQDRTQSELSPGPTPCQLRPRYSICLCMSPQKREMPLELACPGLRCYRSMLTCYLIHTAFPGIPHEKAWDTLPLTSFSCLLGFAVALLPCLPC